MKQLAVIIIKEYLVKMLIFCLCIINSACITKTGAGSDNSKPTIATQWADFIVQQKHSHEKIRTRNKLKDDPEQQEEYTQSHYSHLVSQLHIIAQKIEEENSQETMTRMELASRVLAQAFLQLYRDGNKAALAHADETVSQVAARIKVLQDPFWHMMAKNIAEEKRTALSPSYSIEELEYNLPIPESEQDKLIKLLLEQVELRSKQITRVSEQAFEELALALEPYHKSADKITSRLAKLITNEGLPVAILPVRADNVSREARKLYNDAFIANIAVDARCWKIKKKSDHKRYPEIEAAYEAVALTFIKAHDAGHPNALKQAEKIMTMPLMHVIIKWKEKHHMKDSTGIYLDICKQINKRKCAPTGIIPKEIDLIASPISPDEYPSTPLTPSGPASSSDLPC